MKKKGLLIPDFENKPPLTDIFEDHKACWGTAWYIQNYPKLNRDKSDVYVHYTLLIA